jgi:hypothetical protein
LRALPISRRLQRTRQELDVLHGQVLAEERRAGLTQSQVLHEDFRGIALAWAQGLPLGAIAGRARLSEGDLVVTLQKTLDVLGQLKDAVHSAKRTGWQDLAERFNNADALLRRGVVESSYQWALSGPPDADEQDDEPWPDLEAAPPDDRPRRERRHPGGRKGQGGKPSGQRPPGPSRPRRPPRPRR